MKLAEDSADGFRFSSSVAKHHYPDEALMRKPAYFSRQKYLIHYWNKRAMKHQHLLVLLQLLNVVSTTACPSLLCSCDHGDILDCSHRRLEKIPSWDDDINEMYSDRTFRYCLIFGFSFSPKWRPASICRFCLQQLWTSWLFQRSGFEQQRHLQRPALSIPGVTREYHQSQ